MYSNVGLTTFNTIGVTLELDEGHRTRYLLSELRDQSNPCQYKLEATIKPVRGLPALANIKFYTGRNADGDNYSHIVKMGGRGTSVRVSEDGVSDILLF